LNAPDATSTTATSTAPLVNKMTEATDIASEVPGTSDMSKLFTMVGELTEQVKQCVGVTNKLAPVVQIIEKLEKKVSHDIAELNGRVLIVEQDCKNNMNELNRVSKQIKPVLSTYETLQASVRSNAENVQQLRSEFEARNDATFFFDPATIHDEAQKILDAGLSQYDEKIDDLIEKSNQLTPSNITKIRELITGNTPNITPLINKLNTFEERLCEIQTNLKSKTTAPPSVPKNDDVVVKIKRLTFNQEVIVIGDSNTKKIDMSKIGQGTSRKRFTQYTIPEATDFIETTEVEKEPKKVMIHVGTNDIVIANGNSDTVISDFRVLIEALKKKFPRSRIIISSVFGRKDPNDKLTDPIKNINNILEEICEVTPRFTYLNNGNITHQNMDDGKHVDARGLHIFLSNIRYILFDEPPPMRTRYVGYT
jgi:hypothetical protein